ncbi:MAG: hypothetical protein PUF83_11380 [Intestinibaculum porci]|uniref:hypothetical protein n=1 Tax=Intestinibaculum porci TaxID=2487118 RepID=UPI002409492E|nr:hypothetical protein [Intestinibaculum porci]MDD6423637.1 hypothetical protein [Intestinibaculum porci]
MVKKMLALMTVICLSFGAVVQTYAKSYSIAYLKIKNVTYTGSAIRNMPKVYNEKGKRVPSRYFSVIYDGDTTNAGVVEVSVHGTGKYDGYATGSYVIRKRSIKQCKVRGLKSYDANQGFTNQDLAITYRGQDVSYRLYYDYSAKPGTHTLKIKGLGNFTGTLIKKYRIYATD